MRWSCVNKFISQSISVNTILGYLHFFNIYSDLFLHDTSLIRTHIPSKMASLHSIKFKESVITFKCYVHCGTGKTPMFKNLKEIS